MIGVVARETEHAVIREFFELFKTPWEFCRPGVAYDVLICSNAKSVANPAEMVVVYGCGESALDADLGITRTALGRNTVIARGADRIPIHKSCITLAGPGRPILQTEDGEAVALDLSFRGSSMIRVGFDLFAEVRFLLESGQPPKDARIPALDLHISLLRDWILGHSIRLAEIPPVPAGYDFIVCLTHDVDHCQIRNHRWDHTMFGFLYRATFGSFIGCCTGRESVRQLVANWRAAFSLPFVYLGLAADFWKTFRRYREMEDGLPSTFFVIPKRNDPGMKGAEPAPLRRAAHYDLTEIGEEIRALVSEGCEIGVHGIDAWRDSSKGRLEREAIQAVGGKPETGARIHWLYFDADSPAQLEAAGFSYDSTCGYNETVGYRAGTTQVFQPPKANQLLELPMHVMDTALFYPSYMNLKPSQARTILDEMLANNVRFGGVLTVNWHDRSIAPERLWDQAYRELLEDLKERRAWCATAGQVVSWFRKRRAARFETTGEGRINLAVDPSDDELPGLQIWQYDGGVQPGVPSGPDADRSFRMSQLQT